MTLLKRCISKIAFVRELGEAGELCWEAVNKMDIDNLGKALTATLLSWKKILPLTVPDEVMSELESKYLPNYPGAITSGCGGGYIIVVSERPVDGAVKIKIRY